MNFIINNQEDFQTNSSIHNYITRNKHHFIDQMPTYSFQKGTFHAGIKIFHLVWKSSIMTRQVFQ